MNYSEVNRSCIPHTRTFFSLCTHNIRDALKQISVINYTNVGYLTLSFHHRFNRGPGICSKEVSLQRTIKRTK